jgi:hypothetical protein
MLLARDTKRVSIKARDEKHFKMKTWFSSEPVHFVEHVRGEHNVNWRVCSRLLLYCLPPTCLKIVFIFSFIHSFIHSCLYCFLIVFIRQNSIINVFEYFTDTLTLFYVRNRARTDITTPRRRGAYLGGGGGGVCTIHRLILNRLVKIIIWFFCPFSCWASERECIRRKTDCAFSSNSNITAFVNINIPDKGQQIWWTLFRFCIKQRYNQNGLKPPLKDH